MEKLNGVSIDLTPEKSEQIFFDSMCNGMSYLRGYGLVLDYDKSDYNKARDLLKEQGKGMICREDVWMQILRSGGKLTIIDEEGGDDERFDITLKEVHERVKLTDISILMEMLEERDDATTADCILQTVFFNDVIFG